MAPHQLDTRETVTSRLQRQAIESGIPEYLQSVETGQQTTQSYKNRLYVVPLKIEPCCDNHMAKMPQQLLFPGNSRLQTQSIHEQFEPCTPIGCHRQHAATDSPHNGQIHRTVGLH